LTSILNYWSASLLTQRPITELAQNALQTQLTQINTHKRQYIIIIIIIVIGEHWTVEPPSIQITLLLLLLLLLLLHIFISNVTSFTVKNTSFLIRFFLEQYKNNNVCKHFYAFMIVVT